MFLPPAEETARAEAWLYEGRTEGGGIDGHEVVKAFIDRTDRVFALIEGFVPEAVWLSDSQTLTYLHACISTKRHRVRVPDVPMYLDAFLVDEPLIGGLAPRLGSAHLRVLSIMGVNRLWIWTLYRRARGTPLGGARRERARPHGAL